MNGGARGRKRNCRLDQPGEKTSGSRLPTEIDKIVGANVRRLRSERGLTIQKLAAQIGVSPPQLQKYETATNRLSAGMLPVVAEALAVGLLKLYEHCPVSILDRTGNVDKVEANA